MVKRQLELSGTGLATLDLAMAADAVLGVLHMRLLQARALPKPTKTIPVSRVDLGQTRTKPFGGMGHAPFHGKPSKEAASIMSSV